MSAAEDKNPRLSVVMATFNRRESLLRLLSQLAVQTLPAALFEVIIVDDGSTEAAGSFVNARDYSFRVEVVRQDNAGAAAARHHAIEHAKASLLVIIDDDMQVPAEFLAEHMKQHPKGSRRLVLGRLKADPAIAHMPYFEKWYAALHDKMASDFEKGALKLTGNNVYTGNVSLRRDDYLAVGGFDFSMKRAEDIELGLKLERAGVELHYAPNAYTLHGSDHTDESVWLKRAFLYGVYFSRIYKKHPDAAHADPWRFLFDMQLLARPFLTAATVAPAASKPLSEACIAAVRLADQFGLAKLAHAGSSVVYTMEYCRGARDEAGSLTKAAEGIWRCFRARRS